MDEVLKTERELLRNFLQIYFQQATLCLSSVNRWGSDLLARLGSFTLRGKLLRGSLLLFTRQMFEGKIDSVALKSAAALELLQTGLLIHDDIMDRDLLRRGEPTILAQFSETGRKISSDPEHYASSMSICSGDVAFFLAFEQLAEVELPSAQKSALIKLFSNEMVLVGLGQMDDLYFASSNVMAELADIINIYRFKTARYTFVLPLLAGAILCGREADTLQSLEEIGLDLGIIFQIKDDELGLFGNSEQLGKPIGSDIAEGKKTIFYHYLKKSCNAEEKAIFARAFGNRNLSSEQYRQVLNLFEKYAIRQQVGCYLQILKENVENEIATLPVGNEYKERLRRLLAYNFTRQK